MKKYETTLVHPIRYILADNIRTIRRLKNITQESLALESGLSRAYLSDVERGQRSVSIDVIGRIAEALNVSLDVLFNTDHNVEKFLENKSNLSNSR